jgi:hypothetical protein
MNDLTDEEREAVKELARMIIEKVVARVAIIFMSQLRVDQLRSQELNG